MASSHLDYDILNNMDYVDDIEFSDFTLFPTSNDVDLDQLPDLNFFPHFDFNPKSSCLPIPCSASSTSHESSNNKHRCTRCSESFKRRCDLNRHLLKHTTPYKCSQSGCGAAFAENRRRKQHEKSVHGLATDEDLRKCAHCDYASIRPDAVRRHLKLKHGVSAFGPGARPRQLYLRVDLNDKQGRK
ncbi:hypothetical protein LTR67_009447 [Exophiala xenobiotica]